MRSGSRIAETFVVRAQGATPALVDGLLGRSGAPDGRARSAFVFTMERGRIVGIEIVTEPKALSQMELEFQAPLPPGEGLGRGFSEASVREPMGNRRPTIFACDRNRIASPHPHPPPDQVRGRLFGHLLPIGEGKAYGVAQLSRNTFSDFSNAAFAFAACSPVPKRAVARASSARRRQPSHACCSATAWQGSRIISQTAPAPVFGLPSRPTACIGTQRRGCRSVSLK